MTIPKYPEYKDSQVDWLGKVPSHWKVDRLKVSVKSCKNGIWGDESQDDDDDIPCVRVADFDRKKLQVILENPTIRNVTQKERVHRTLQKGNLLLEKSGGGELQPVGCVVLYNDDRPAICSNFVAKIELADGMNPSFWRYVHAAAYSIRLTTGAINQTSGIQNLDQDRYFNESAVFPPLGEQQAIANFLDFETSKIDALITEQEKLIELLKEKRQAVISHAVTKGIDPTIKMRDSGVKWLGLIPNHWGVSQSRRLFQERNQRANSGERQLTASQKYGVIFQDEFMAMEGQKVVQVIHGADILKHAEPDDFVISMRSFQGGIEWCGNSGSISSAYVMLTPVKDVYSRFFKHLFKSRSYIQALQSTTNLVRDGQALRFSNFSLVDLPLIPLDEQKAISDYLDKVLSKYDALVAEANRYIELLKERRAILISDAVTGKMDVRDVAINLEAA